MSFQISLTGLRGAQSNLSTISNNIANAATTGFKRSRVEFGDIRPPSINHAGIGSRQKAIRQEFGQGGYAITARDLDVAISGNGFLVTREPGDSGRTLYTRNGALSVSLDNRLVDSNGALVLAMPVDARGVATASDISSLVPVTLPATSGAPRATSTLALTAALPRSATKPASDPSFAPPAVYAFDPANPASYNLMQTTTVVDANGQPVSAKLYFARTQSRDAGDATDQWDVHVMLGDKNATASPITLQFDVNGVMTSPTGPTTLDTVQPTGAAAPLAITLDFGATTALGSGSFAVSGVTQNGFVPAKFAGLSIGDSGQLVASFADGSTQFLGQIALAGFANMDGLRAEGDARWSSSANSGPALVGAPGRDGRGDIRSGMLEQANIDLTEELVALIEAQRNFQANAKAIDTANAMDQTIINLRN